MIVVDANVMVYLFIRGPFTADAAATYRRDGSWNVPYLWRSEFRNVLSLYNRQGTKTVGECVYM